MGTSDEMQADQAGRQQDQPDNPRRPQRDQFMGIARDEIIGAAGLDEIENSGNQQSGQYAMAGLSHG